jgi:hypothetical protein
MLLSPHVLRKPSKEERQHEEACEEKVCKEEVRQEEVREAEDREAEVCPQEGPCEAEEGREAEGLGSSRSREAEASGEA